MELENIEFTIKGRIVKSASLKDEWDIDVDDPELYVDRIKEKNIKADLFTFPQRLPYSTPKHGYYMEWDSIAAIPSKSYEYWLKWLVAKNSRKKIRTAKRKGVEIKECEFNDEFVNGILEIYHESPMLQGKPNRQFNTDFNQAKMLNGTYLDRAKFIGAFYKEELIGYIKLVDAGRFMRTMGILSKKAHHDKSPINLLLAKAVEICSAKGTPYLTYAKYKYGKRGSQTLQKFKRNLGFESIIVPRYYIPLNQWGKIVLKLKLHRDAIEYLPEKFIRIMLSTRKKWLAQKYFG